MASYKLIWLSAIPLPKLTLHVNDNRRGIVKYFTS